jgi:deoxyribonucleoside regulator
MTHASVKRVWIAPMDRDDSQLAKIARLYYEGGLTLRQIAKRMATSIATVSRSLSAARAAGIVDIRIHDPLADHHELEMLLESTYGLRECLVVPDSSQEESTYRSLAHALGALLPRLLRPGMLLGLSWGQTLKAIAEFLQEDRRLGVDTVPAVGAMGVVETGIYPNAIAKTFAEKLGGRSYLINTPAIFDSRRMRVSAERESHFQPIRRLWDRLDALLLSVSGLDESASVVRHRILPRRDIEELRSIGVVCATNFIMLDGTGKEAKSDLDGRMLRVGLDTVLKTTHRVLIACGIRKQEAIRAALAAQIATVLLTDLETARRLS